MDLRAFFSLLRLTLAGYTDGVVNVMSAAWRIAASRGHHCVTPEHLLAGLATTKYVPTRALLGQIGLNFHAVPESMPELAGSTVPCSPTGRISLGPEVRDLLSRARELARGMGHSYVGTGHLVLSFLEGPGGQAGDDLRKNGVSEEAIRAALASNRV